MGVLLGPGEARFSERGLMIVNQEYIMLQYRVLHSDAVHAAVVREPGKLS